MNINKVIQINEYKRKKTENKKNKINYNYIDNKEVISEEENRKDTFNLFMRVLSSIREESY